MTKKRNVYLDIIKAINIILVVIGHCIQLGAGNEYSMGEFYENPIFMFIYSFHMPLFMLISGYLFAYSFKSNKWNKILLTRFKQLIIPLCSWSVISLFILIGKNITGISSISINVVWIFKQLIIGIIYGPWLLWAVWWCGLVIVLVNKFFNDNPIIYVVGSLLTLVLPDVFNLSLYKFMWPYFLLAYIFNAYDYKNKLKYIYLSKGFISCSFFIFIILLHFYNYDTYIYTSGYNILKEDMTFQLYNNCFRFIIGMMGSISVMYLVYALMKIMPEGIRKLIIYIGKNTFGIYIISGIIISEGLSMVTDTLNGINYIYIFIETIGVLFLSIVLNDVLKRFPLTNRLFLGGR